MTKQFAGQIGQISQQINSVVMGLAGAAAHLRAAWTEPVEQDEGYVERVVNAKSTATATSPSATAAPSTGPASGPGSIPHGDGIAHLHPARRATCASTTSTSATTPGQDRPARHLPVRQARPEGRLRRRHRRGQDHDHEPHQPLLRHRRRQDPLRRHQHQQDQEGRPAPLPGRGAAGHQPVHRHRHGQHPLRPAGRHRRGVHRRGAARRRRRLHHAACPTATTRCSRTTAPTSPRASGSCSSIARCRRGRPAGDDPRRGHLLHRHAHRGHRPARHGRAHDRAHRVRHRPPPLDRAATPTRSWSWTTAASSSAAATTSSSPRRARTTSSTPGPSSSSSEKGPGLGRMPRLSTKADKGD